MDLERLERPTGGLARNISVDQVRSLGDLLSVTPSMSAWRAIIIDAADDLEAIKDIMHRMESKLDVLLDRGSRK